MLAKLREMNGAWPLVDSIVITHWHLDHWGDLVPWVWGNMVGPGKGEDRPELWLPPQGRARIRDFGTRLGWEDMFETTFDVHDYEEDVPFRTAAGLDVLALRLPHYTLRTYGLRVSNGSHTLAYSGDSGPDDRLTEVAARRRSLRLRGHAAARRAGRQPARPPFGRGSSRGLRGLQRQAPPPHAST